MIKQHYVYRITNTIINKHYYGVRSSKIEPKLDLGIKYFSSSTDKEFIKEQKLNKDIFKYKIVKIFDNRKDAYIFEIKLHNKFDVACNDSFYNLAKSTTTKFSIVGNKTASIKISEARKNKMNVKNVLTNEFIGMVDLQHPKVLSGEWVHISKNIKLSEEHKDKIRRPGTLNGRYSGLTDEYILEISIEYFNIFNEIPSWPKLIEYCNLQNIHMIQSLTPFRFNDGIIYGIKGYFNKMFELTGKKYNPYNKLRYLNITEKLIKEYKENK